MCRMLPANPTTDNSGAARDNRDNPHPPHSNYVDFHA